jgi:mono/diheme cytochrome c family protein
VYRAKGCAACHGHRGEGNIGPALGQIVAGVPKERVAQLMWNHAPKMGEKMSAYSVPWPSFEADEMANLFAFLNAGLQSAPVKINRPRSPAETSGGVAEKTPGPEREPRRNDP